MTHHGETSLKKKWQLTATIVALLVVVVGMNSIADLQRQKAESLAKEAEKARMAAEASAAAAHAKDAPPSDTHGEQAFALPDASGPQTAPVKLEVFVNNTNSCHQVNVTELNALPKAYGKLLRVEWLSMSDPKIAARSDMQQIACDAGLLINGKPEYIIERLGGKMTISFRGPTGDKYKMGDLYLVINNLLRQQSKAVPAAAQQKAK